jgi:hypothetical protein
MHAKPASTQCGPLPRDMCSTRTLCALMLVEHQLLQPLQGTGGSTAVCAVRAASHTCTLLWPLRLPVERDVCTPKCGLSICMPMPCNLRPLLQERTPPEAATQLQLKAHPPNCIATRHRMVESDDCTAREITGPRLHRLRMDVGPAMPHTRASSHAGRTHPALPDLRSSPYAQRRPRVAAAPPASAHAATRLLPSPSAWVRSAVGRRDSVQRH